jgi:hypothetical protein
MNRDSRPKKLLASVAALTACCLLLLTAPPAAAGQKPSDRAATPDRRERRMVVLTSDGGENQPVVLTRMLGGGFLGVELTPLTPELRAHFGVPADRGVMVARIEEDSPAARAGLQVGDVITGIDGATVDTPWDLGSAVRTHAAGENADLVVWRGGRSLDLRVTVEERAREQIDLGRFFDLGPGGGPEVLEWRGKGAPGDGAALYFAPESVERLRQSLDKIDWPQLDRKLLTDRNRELEQRLESLEKRLKELEEALKSSGR